MQTGTYARQRLVTSALVLLGIALLWLALGGTAFADDAPPACGGKILEKCTPNSGDTAWMLASVALVLMMTIPGLGLFYGGMVRKKNVGDTVMTSFAVTCLVTILFAVCTYSMAFRSGSPFIGGLDRMFLKDILSDIGKGGIGNPNPLAATIPEAVYICFQMTFAIITPALIAGAFAERMKFSAMLWFIGLWAIFVYAPIAHWVWGPDGIFSSGNDAAWVKVLDFAGGTVVHINAGVAGLMCAIMLGKRADTGPAHNMVLTFIGASLLWVGWFGFNAGSAVTAGMQAGMAMLVTQIATAVAGFTWMLVEWALKGKPTVVGICSGAVAGLVAITPASGFVGPAGALAIGAAAGVIATRPATAPVQMPITVGLPRMAHSTNIQVSAAVAVAICVTVMAMPACMPAVTAEPALKPNQPTHSREAPMKVSTMLWAGPVSLRLPSINAAIRPATPELMCTTVPPAKSRTFTSPSLLAALRNPSGPHTQCAMGA